MNPLKLSPLPCMRLDETSSAQSHPRDGFVDDAVVQALLAGPSMTRQSADHADLVLAADDMDFAGWCLPETQSSRSAELSTRRAAPPELDEPGLGEPHRGSHRWWLAGLAGVLSTLLFSVLLVTLSSRTASMLEDSSITRVRAKAQIPATPKPDNAKSAPALTGVSGLK